MTETTANEVHDGHGHGEPPSYDDINTPVIVLVGAIAAIVTLITIGSEEKTRILYRPTSLTALAQRVTQQRSAPF